MTDCDRLHETLSNTRKALLNARNTNGVWEGRLSSSPLATAVAVFALHQVDAERHRPLIFNGLKWLAGHQQSDGSWGDAETLDPGNLSTTLLCYAAFSAIDPQCYSDTVGNAEAAIKQQCGGLSSKAIANRLYQIYGKDRTFAVPILTMCVMAGVLGEDGWQYVKPLPFELAILPRFLFRWLRLTVVSYALPALIAIGQVRFSVNPPANPLMLILRKWTQRSTLKLLEKVQPSNGGFLEATPLTSFVTMSLAAMNLKTHPVVEKGVRFITQSVSSDGSWPIDTNLSTWVTSLSVQALAEEDLSSDDKQVIADWYLAQQYTSDHVYTGAKPGGWGWTNLPGAVPDADDTAGALVALSRLEVRSKVQKDYLRVTSLKGIQWLLDLQNTDGGMPTFCKGWGRLEFDRSCPDITAHAIAAWQIWKTRLGPSMQGQIANAVHRALNYLEAVQSDDGSWLPLWFGNPHSHGKTNPVYGTAKVLEVLADFDKPLMIEQGVQFLTQAQNADGGWGAQKGQAPTIEETALAVDALLAADPRRYLKPIQQGVAYLIEATDCGRSFPAAPIGLYFAKLWYAERLYPTLFSLKALRAAETVFGLTDSPADGTMR